MKNLKTFLSITFLAALLFGSCQNEEDVLIENNENTNTKQSEPAEYIERSTANDGSEDDILDDISCASVILPVVAEVNGQELTIVNEASLTLIAEIFAEFTNDEDEVRFQFPIEMRLSDYSVVTIQNEQELEALEEACEAADESRDDAISCLEFDYPITVFTFDANAQQTGSVVLTSDQEAYAFINDLGDDQYFSLQYPISLSGSSDGSITINSDAELIAELQSCESEDDLEEEARDEAEDLREDLEEAITGAHFELESGVQAGAEFSQQFANYTFEFTNDKRVVVRNSLTNLVTNVEAFFNTTSESEVFLELNFTSDSEFSVLNGTFEVVSQSSSTIELQSTTDTTFKLVFSKL